MKWLVQGHTASPGLPGSSAGKESACKAGDPGSIPGSGRSPGEGIGYPLQYSWASLVAQLVKNPPALWETWVRSLGWKDPLEKGKGTHSSILAGEFHGQYSLWSDKEPDTTERLSLSHFIHILKYHTVYLKHMHFFTCKSYFKNLEERKVIWYF